MMSFQVDIVIIGAGPVGLYAAYQSGDKGFKVALVDALPEVGGQLTALYPQKQIFDVAGFPGVTATELVSRLKEQALSYSPKIMTDFRVDGIEPLADGLYQVSAEDGRKVTARYVIIAAGAGMISPRKLSLPEIEKYLGNGFEYVVSDTEDYRDKKVLIIGGGDTALDWANYFVEMASSVTLVHRTDHFVGFEASLQKLRESSCTIHTFSGLTAIRGNDKVELAEITNKKEEWVREIEVDRILCCIGYTPKLGILKNIGLELTEGSIAADDNLRTNLPNIYAIGDIANYPGRIRLISTGFGSVQKAVGSIVETEAVRVRHQNFSDK